MASLLHCAAREYSNEILEQRRPVIVQAALNGTRTRADHSCVPLTPVEQAIDAQSSIAAGAGAIHVHVRDPHGQESLAAEDVSNTVEAIRRACPGIPVGVGTGAWIIPDLRRRLSEIQSWTTLPDFASVNLHEAGAAHVIELLLEKGVGVEAGIWNAPAAVTLIKSGLAESCLRVLLEPAEASCSARTNLLQMEEVLKGVTPSRLLHGLGPCAWRLVELAATRGYDTRIGFEDTLRLPDGSTARSNAELVLAARAIIARVEVQPTSIHLTTAG
jgi:uncharacterized protein (DUF849 family)